MTAARKRARPVAEYDIEGSRISRPFNDQFSRGMGGLGGLRALPHTLPRPLSHPKAMTGSLHHSTPTWAPPPSPVLRLLFGHERGLRYKMTKRQGGYQPRWGPQVSASARIELKALKPIFPAHYHHKAAIEIQRCWRGRRDRRAIWGFCGAGSQYMARRIQRLVRGFLGRRRALTLVKRLICRAVVRIQALYWGFKARQRVRLIRAAIYNRAVCKLQTIYRGVLGRRWAEAVRFMLHTAKAIRIQKSWRMNRGLTEARAVHAMMLRQDASLQRLLSDYREGRLLPRVYAYQAPIRRQDDDGGDEEDRPPIPPEPPSEDLFLEVVSFIITCKHKYDLAHKMIHDLLNLYPGSVRAMYLKAIVCQLMWAEVGALKMSRPDVLEEGLHWLRKARRADGPERMHFTRLESDCFRTALRLYPSHPLTVLAVAVAAQSVYGFFDDELPPRPPKPPPSMGDTRRGSDDTSKRPRSAAEGTKPKPGGAPAHPGAKAGQPAPRHPPPPAKAPWEFRMQIAYKRCKSLYRRCQSLDPEGTYCCVAANERVFQDLFISKRLVVLERNKPFKPIIPPPSVPVPLAAALGPSGRVSSKAGAKEEAGVTKTSIIIHRAGFRMVVSITENIAQGSQQCQKRLMPEIVLHEEEVAEAAVAAAEADILSGVPEVVVRGKDRYALVAELLLRRMALVTKSPHGLVHDVEALKKGEKMVVLTTLTRARDMCNKNVVMDRASLQIQRVLRGMLGRMKVRRLHRRLEAKAEQDERLSIVLSKTRAYRQMRLESARHIQAVFRGWCAWRTYRIILWATYVIQTAYKHYRDRKSAEIEMRRKQQVVQVIECFRGGMTISGRPVMLVVHRAGLNFRITAHDQQTVQTYTGFIYEPAIQEMLQRDGRVKAWMKDKVMDLLISRIALVDALSAPTAELDDINRGMTIILHQERGGEVSTKGVKQMALNRPLRDKYAISRKYQRILMKQRDKALGLGLIKDGFAVLRPFKPRPE